jgi:hypothetical protein
MASLTYCHPHKVYIPHLEECPFCKVIRLREAAVIRYIARHGRKPIEIQDFRDDPQLALGTRYWSEVEGLVDDFDQPIDQLTFNGRVK